MRISLLAIYRSAAGRSMPSWSGGSPDQLAIELEVLNRKSMDFIRLEAALIRVQSCKAIRPH